MKKIAIIEDDPVVNDMFCRWIQEAKPDFLIDQYVDRESAEAGLEKNDYALIVLDIELSPWDRNAGIGLINNINVRKPCPVLVVSGLTSDIYRPIMRELKAWDYMVKPVSEEQKGFFLTLVMDAVRLGQAIPKQTGNGQADSAWPEPHLNVDPLRKTQATWKGKALNLPMTDQRLIHYLVTHADKLVTFDELFPLVPSGRNQINIRSHIHAIRSAFKEVDDDFDSLRNVPMAGYIWQLHTK
ncbi:MAG: DNA-binding response regulator [Comamonadaceae bacterium]|nr:MAG: DNA-binding response regulator [Comamonadaceae bacterium]